MRASIRPPRPQRRRPRPLAPHTQRLIELWNAGASPDQIVAACGYSTKVVMFATVQNLRQRGYDLAKRPRNPRVYKRGAPLLAEVSSGARFGPNLVVAYRELLRDDAFGGRVQRAVVFGHPTLSREVPALLTRDDVEVIVVAPSGAEFYNPGRRARVIGGVTAPADLDLRSPEVRARVGSWVFGSRRLVEAAEHAADPAAVPQARTAEAVCAELFG